MKAVSGSKLSFTFRVEGACERVTLIWDRDRELLDIYHGDEYASTTSLEKYFNNINHSMFNWEVMNETIYNIHKWLVFLIKKINYNMFN